MFTALVNHAKKNVSCTAQMRKDLAGVGRVAQSSAASIWRQQTRWNGDMARGCRKTFFPLLSHSNNSAASERRENLTERTRANP